MNLWSKVHLIILFFLIAGINILTPFTVQASESVNKKIDTTISKKINKNPNTNEIVIGLESLPEVLNPIIKSGTLVFTLGGQLFTGLTRLNKEGKAIPYLAQNWCVSDDGLRYIFDIRQGAKFHDGTPITAEDIIFSVEASQQNHPFYPFLESIASVQVAQTSKTKESRTEKSKDKILQANAPISQNQNSTQSIQINLKKPLPILPSLLIPIFVPIMPKHIYDTKEPLKDNPANFDVVGSGPFMLKSYEKNKHIQLIKNPNFFLAKQTKVESLLYKIFMDNHEMAYALGVGDVDIAMLYSTKEIDNFFQNFPREQYNEYHMDYIYPYFLVTYNYRKQLFANPKVREAFSLAIDRKNLVKYFLDSRLYAMYGPTPPDSPFYDNEEHAYDVKKANKLLDEAGYKRNANGKRFTVMVDYFDYPLTISLMRWLQNEFSSKLGIELKAREVKDLAQRDERLIAGDFDLFLDELFAWHDPLIGLHRLYSSKNIGKNVLWTNIGNYENPKVDALFDTVVGEADEKNRKKLYGDLQKVLSNDNAALWLITNKYSMISKLNIHNLENLPYCLMSPFLNVYKTEE